MPPIDTFVATEAYRQLQQRVEAAEREARRSRITAQIWRALAIVAAWVAVWALAAWQLSPLIEAWAAG